MTPEGTQAWEVSPAHNKGENMTNGRSTIWQLSDMTCIRSWPANGLLVMPPLGQGVGVKNDRRAQWYLTDSGRDSPRLSYGAPLGY